MIEEFERHLRGTNLSENTVTSYLFAVRQFGERHDAVTKRNLKEHKAWLIEQYKPKTVNLRIRAINCYLESIGKDSWKLSSVKVQQKAFLENVISEADYIYFKNCLSAMTICFGILSFAFWLPRVHVSASWCKSKLNTLGLDTSTFILKVESCAASTFLNHCRMKPLSGWKKNNRTAALSF